VLYTSRARWRAEAFGLKRGEKLHRIVIRQQLRDGGLGGRPLSELAIEELLADRHVHHQNFNKRCVCDGNLVLMPASLNPSGAKRDPYTGEFLSREQWRRRYGE
jgi:hypothetical protein